MHPLASNRASNSSVLFPCACCACACAHVLHPCASCACACAHVLLPCAGCACAFAHVLHLCASCACAFAHVLHPCASCACAFAHVLHPCASCACACAPVLLPCACAASQQLCKLHPCACCIPDPSTVGGGKGECSLTRFLSITHSRWNHNNVAAISVVDVTSIRSNLILFTQIKCQQFFHQLTQLMQFDSHNSTQPVIEGYQPISLDVRIVFAFLSFEDTRNKYQQK